VQKGMLARTFGCCRYVYNWALSLKSEEYRQTGKSLTYGDLSALLPLTQTTIRHNMAFERFLGPVAAVLEAS
jgi:transposase